MECHVLYHGTNYPEEIQQFWSNSHFGSKRASIDAVAAKWIDAKEAELKGGLPSFLTVEPDQHRRIIEVELNYDNRNCLNLDEDWGNPNAVALSNTLRKLTGFTELFQPIYDKIFAYNVEIRSDHSASRENRSSALRAFGNPLIAEALASRDIQLIKYVNIVEGKTEEGEYDSSYCVFDPTIIRIRQSLQVKDDDLVEGVKRLLKIKYPDREFAVKMGG